jgi:hypothetical protein
MKRVKAFVFPVLMLFALSFALRTTMASEKAVSPDAIVDTALQADPTPAGRSGYAPSPSSLASYTPGTAPVLITTMEDDQKAQIYDMKGTVKVGKKGGKEWLRAEKGMFIEPGDVLLTSKFGRAMVTFDQRYMNVVEVKANTRAVFKAIEPTELAIEDGTVYNIFDSLPKNSSWNVSTPTSVAAVRGTRFFVQYKTLSGEIVAANFNVEEDQSLVTLIDVLPDGSEGASLDIPEGKSIFLSQDQFPDASHLEGIDPKILREFKEILEKVLEMRKKGQQLPTTAGEFDPTPNLQQNILDNAVPELDQVLDIRNQNLPPPDQEIPQSGDDSFGDDRGDGYGEEGYGDNGYGEDGYGNDGSGDDGFGDDGQGDDCGQNC